MTLRTLNYGNYGIFLIITVIMGNAGFCPSTEGLEVLFNPLELVPERPWGFLHQHGSIRSLGGFRDLEA